MAAMNGDSTSANQSLNIPGWPGTFQQQSTAPKNPSLNISGWPGTFGGKAAPSVGVSSTPAGSSYTIKKGDNLSSIAASHGVTLEALRAANPEFTSNPKYQGGNMIFSGGQVNLPSMSTPGRARTISTPPSVASHTSAQPAVGGSFMQTPGYNAGSSPVAPKTASPAPTFGGLPRLAGFPTFGGASKPSVPDTSTSRAPSQFVPGISKLPAQQGSVQQTFKPLGSFGK